MKKRPKILVVGSLMMNQGIETSVIPEEGQTVMGEDIKKSPGGKGANQAVQMARLGADVTLIGKIGRDRDGEELVKVCKEAGVNTEQIIYDDVLPTGSSIVLLETVPGQKVKKRSIVIPGATTQLTVDEIAYLEDEMDKYDLVVLQNAIPMEVNEAIAGYAYKHEVDVVLNPIPAKKLSKELMECVTYMIVNEQAAKSMTGIKIHSDWKREWTRFNLDEARVASAVIRGRGVPTVLITLAEKGVIMNTPERFYYKKAIEDVEVVDPRAAGDAFIGAFCTRICTDDSIGKVLSIANYTAALSIATEGAIESLPTSNQVREYMEQKEMHKNASLFCCLNNIRTWKLFLADSSCWTSVCASSTFHACICIDYVLSVSFADSSCWASSFASSTRNTSV